MVIKKTLLGAVMVLGLASVTANASLVANGSFETGNFSGWTQGGNTGFTSVSNSVAAVHSGTYGGLLGPSGSVGTLTQSIATTVGQQYSVSFWLNNLGAGTNSFSASFGSTLLSLSNKSAFTYTLYTFLVQATTSTTNLVFTFRQDPNYWSLDDVNVQAVPIPAALPLLAAGLGGIGLMARHRKRKVAAAA
jgi:hypothetical protein